MCGIVGYSGVRRAAPVLLEGLEKLEYRGYDSAGIAVCDGGVIRIAKKKGRVKEIAQAADFNGSVGIGHTRWATHGKPSERNAHPHVYGKFAIVHNGIIENATELKEECLARGESFASETDSEVLVHLVAACYRGNFLQAVSEGLRRCQGSYAVAVLCEDFPDEIVCARGGSPLVVGVKEGETFIASDLAAIASERAEVYVAEEGEFVCVKAGSAVFYDRNLVVKQKERLQYDYNGDSPEKMGFRHFMQKEMSEIPSVLKKSKLILSNREFYKVLCQTKYIDIIACGTAYHSGLCAKYAFESLCRVKTEASIASEYRYCNPIVGKKSLVIAVSQSGETADTLAAAALAKERGAYLAAATNVPYSSLTRLADYVLPTDAGFEVAVAATKSFNAQLALLYSLADLRSGGGGEWLKGADALAERVLEVSEGVRAWTPYFLNAKSVYFIGRGVDYCTALEGSLKLKEITYLPSEGYPAGELKHGTLALVDEGTPVVAIITQKALAEKTMNAVHETRARGARVFLVTSLPECAEHPEVTASVVIPACREIFSPVLSMIPLQKLAYYVSIARGIDPDKPRNLAKSVTVE